MFDISVRVQKFKRKVAFQIKLALCYKLDTVQFHAAIALCMHKWARILDSGRLTEPTVTR